MNIEQLRALRKNSGNTLAKIASELQKQDSYRKDDDRFWKLEGDKLGNGSAVIRFLPATKEGDLPWVKVYSHGFKGPSGKWYIENCLTTIGQADPVVEHCNTLYASGLESDKKIAGERKRKLAYITNVLVVSDPKHPENEGTVRLFKFGKKIFDKIKDKLQPTFEDEKAVDVFSPWEGANFRLRMSKVEGYSNFDKSVFDGESEITDDDEQLLQILNGRHDLQEFVSPQQFKSYDELKRKLEMVLGGGTVQSKAEDVFIEEPVQKVKAQKPIKEKAAPAPKASEDDEDLSFFESLIDE